MIAITQAGLTGRLPAADHTGALSEFSMDSSVVGKPRTLYFGKDEATISLLRIIDFAGIENAR